jgi:hypothetical protein
MGKMKKKILIVLLVLLSFFIMGKVLALEINWPTSPFGTDLTVDSKLPDMVKYFYEWGIAIGGIAVFVALLFGGFLYLTSAGDPARLREAKDRIFSALTGLALLLGSWVILNTINPELTVLRPPSFEKPVVGVDVSALEGATERKSCDHVTIYKETYWKGNATSVCALESPPEPYDVENIGFKDFKSLRFFRRCGDNEVCGADGKLILITTTTVATTVDSEVTTTVITIETKTPINCENANFICLHSDKNYEPVSTSTSICYREGGSCTLEFYTTGMAWLIWPVCGDKIGNTNASLHNSRLALYTDKDIKCIKISQTGFEE